MNEEKNCPCCPNHCDVNSLSCRRGREYFNSNSDEVKNHHDHHYENDESSMTIDERVIYKIFQCGHFLHHSETEVNLDFLSNEEKEDLIMTLSKCLNNWK